MALFFMAVRLPEGAGEGALLTRSPASPDNKEGLSCNKGCPCLHLRGRAYGLTASSPMKSEEIKESIGAAQSPEGPTPHPTASPPQVRPANSSQQSYTLESELLLYNLSLPEAANNTLCYGYTHSGTIPPIWLALGPLSVGPASPGNNDGDGIRGAVPLVFGLPVQVFVPFAAAAAVIPICCLLLALLFWHRKRRRDQTVKETVIVPDEEAIPNPNPLVFSPELIAADLKRSAESGPSDGIEVLEDPGDHWHAEMSQSMSTDSPPEPLIPPPLTLPPPTVAPKKAASPESVSLDMLRSETAYPRRASIVWSEGQRTGLSSVVRSSLREQLSTEPPHWQTMADAREPHQSLDDALPLAEPISDVDVSLESVGLDMMLPVDSWVSHGSASGQRYDPPRQSPDSSAPAAPSSHGSPAVPAAARRRGCAGGGSDGAVRGALQQFHFPAHAPPPEDVDLEIEDVEAHAEGGPAARGRTRQPSLGVWPTLLSDTAPSAEHAALSPKSDRRPVHRVSLDTNPHAPRPPAEPAALTSLDRAPDAAAGLATADEERVPAHRRQSQWMAMAKDFESAVPPPISLRHSLSSSPGLDGARPRANSHGMRPIRVRHSVSSAGSEAPHRRASSSGPPIRLRHSVSSSSPEAGRVQPRGGAPAPPIRMHSRHSIASVPSEQLRVDVDRPPTQGQAQFVQGDIEQGHALLMASPARRRRFTAPSITGLDVASKGSPSTPTIEEALRWLEAPQPPKEEKTTVLADKRSPPACLPPSLTSLRTTRSPFLPPIIRPSLHPPPTLPPSFAPPPPALRPSRPLPPRTGRTWRAQRRLGRGEGKHKGR